VTPPPAIRWRIPLTVLSIALFGAALTQPAFFLGKSPHVSGPSLRLLLEGWRALPHGYVEWCANPALLVSWATVLRRRPGISLAAACVAAGLMLMFLSRRTLALPHAGPDPLLVAVSCGPGYWLWVGSALLMIVAGARGPRISIPKSTPRTGRHHH
jgi:hypothetical protein